MAVQVFYEPTALARCEEGSTIFLRLCSALEAFDVAVDADQLELNTAPSWPILEAEEEWDRRAEAAAVTRELGPNPDARSSHSATGLGNANSRPLYTATSGGSTGPKPVYTAKGERRDGDGGHAQQQWRGGGAEESEGGVAGWMAEAASEVEADKVCQG